METITDEQEAKLVVIMFLLVMLILALLTVAALLSRMIQLNREHHFKMNVIIDNLIELVINKYDGKENRDEGS